MNDLENRMTDLLRDLKANHGVAGTKSEFEDEGASFEEAVLLKRIANRAGVDFTLKIGGCGALNDLYEAKKMEVYNIVSPMIESDYALKKFVRAVHTAYSVEEYDRLNLYINIETVNGYNNIDDIFKTQEMEEITGIILGRADMAGSIKLTREDVNSNEIFSMANSLAVRALKANKKFIIGGNVTSESLEFFKMLPIGYLSAFETRKIIFDAKKAFERSKEEVAQGILKALNFELLWLKNKRSRFGVMHGEDLLRQASLENLCSKHRDETYA